MPCGHVCRPWPLGIHDIPLVLQKQHRKAEDPCSFFQQSQRAHLSVTVVSSFSASLLGLGCSRGTVGGNGEDFQKLQAQHVRRLAAGSHMTRAERRSPWVSSDRQRVPLRWWRAGGCQRPVECGSLSARPGAPAVLWAGCLGAVARRCSACEVTASWKDPGASQETPEGSEWARKEGLGKAGTNRVFPRPRGCPERSDGQRSAKCCCEQRRNERLCVKHYPTPEGATEVRSDPREDTHPQKVYLGCWRRRRTSSRFTSSWKLGLGSQFVPRTRLPTGLGPVGGQGKQHPPGPLLSWVQEGVVSSQW